MEFRICADPNTIGVQKTQLTLRKYVVIEFVVYRNVSMVYCWWYWLKILHLANKQASEWKLFEVDW